jgi:hypothetical protein
MALTISIRSSKACDSFQWGLPFGSLVQNLDGELEAHVKWAGGQFPPHIVAALENVNNNDQQV